MKRAIGLILLSALALPAETRSIDDFFRDFTAEWVRGNPNLATGARYFTGEEQDRLERQLTPAPEGYRRAPIQLASKGLAELGRFDRARMNETIRHSPDLVPCPLDPLYHHAPVLH